MSDDKNSAAKLINLMYIVRSFFRETHIFAESLEGVRSVSTNVIPFKASESMVADITADNDHGSLTFSIDSELTKPPNVERAAIGASVTIHSTGKSWHVDAEIGWSGQNVGWDPIRQYDFEVADIVELTTVLPDVVSKLLSEYQQEAVHVIRRQ